ncbi:MAG TPA: patatin-like phospholipase family protein [Nitrospirales bacterium]|jgi:predicted acylesterase/phospholipase RssA
MAARSRLALALSGGGFTGYLFEIGALTALDDLFDDGFSVTDFNFYVGVSAGSAAAALMANGVKPEEVLRANLLGERPYYFERRDIFVPAMGEGFRSITRLVQQFGQVFTMYLRNGRHMGLVGLLEKAQETLPCGIYALDPFARYLETTFAAKGLSNSFEGLRHALYIPAIDLETGQSVVFGDEGWGQVPISKAVTASSAAPIYFCPVRIAGREYIDAGIGRFDCFDLAAQKAADFMLIIHPSPLLGMAPLGALTPTNRSANPRHRGFLSISDLASRINLEARFRLALDLNRREHPGKFFVICPDPAESVSFERSRFLTFQDRIHLLRCGYLSATQMIQKHVTELQPTLARHGISISIPQMEERMRIRLQQFDDGAHASSQGPQRSPGHAGPTAALSKVPG